MRQNIGVIIVRDPDDPSKRWMEDCLLDNLQACMRKGWSLAVQPKCLKVKGRVVCGTVYGEMHLKDLLGSFVGVGYRIPVPDFYLVLHGLRCRKSTIMD